VDKIADTDICIKEYEKQYSEEKFWSKVTIVAKKAGIKAGDIIIQLEGTDIATMSQLQELLSYYPAGAEVEFLILRPQGNDEYQEIEITVTLADASILQMQ
jgi:S1-C subfamily serine protease